MFDLKNITQADLANGSALANLEDAIAKSKKIFIGCDYYEQVKRVLAETWANALGQPAGFIRIYCSPLSEAIELISQIGLIGVNCKPAFEFLGTRKKAAEILEMIPYLEEYLIECRNSVRNDKSSLLPLSLS